MALDAGQSNADNKHNSYSGAGRIAFKAEAETALGGHVLNVNGATDSSGADKEANASNYWWDNATGTKGTAYTVNFQNMLDDLAPVRPRWIIWAQGEQDSNIIGGSYTKAEFKTATLAIFNQMRADIGQHLQILVEPIGRHLAHGNTGGMQAVRDVHQELASEYSWITLGAEKFDLSMGDNVHLDQAGYEEICERNARVIAGQSGALGPMITGASYSGSSVTVTIAHDGGTDFTPTTAIEGFYVEDDGVSVSITSAVRTDTTTITLTLASAPAGGSDVRLWYGYDDMGSINTANLVKDNSTNTLPLRACSNLIVSEV